MTTFSVKDDNPFRIFRILQDIARAKFGDGGFIDLSRGDPGYGFTPSVRGRTFASLILALDSELNHDSENRFLEFDRKDLPKIEVKIGAVISAVYSKETADNHRALLKEFINATIEAAAGEGKKWDTFDVLWHLFAYCPMSGGSYLHPKGQEIARIIVAFWHRQGGVDQAAAADLLQERHIHHQPALDLVMIGDGGKGLQFAVLGALAVVEMEKGHLAPNGGDGSGHAAVEPAADQGDGRGAGHVAGTQGRRPSWRRTVDIMPKAMLAFSIRMCGKVSTET